VGNRESEDAREKAIDQVRDKAVLRGRPVGTRVVVGERSGTVSTGDALRVGVVSDSVFEKGLRSSMPMS